MMLEMRGVSAGYAALRVVHGINLEIAAGEIVTLIGANGAGKSTLVKTISGLLRPMAGVIHFDGQAVQSMPTAARVRLGIVHVPEGRQIFAGLTVAENLGLGAYARRGDRQETADALRAVCARFPVLGQRMAEVAGNFSGGQQQMLAIGRGLMANPRLLILDEPSLGLSPLLVSEIFSLIRALRDEGIAILLSEQNARAALGVADRGYVVENGHIALHAPAAELLTSPEVAERYLGIGRTPDIAEAGTQRTVERIRTLVWS